jgi:mercuric ion binding protein
MRLFGRKQKGRQIELAVSGMSCEHCEMRVRNALMAVEGVIEAKVDHARGQAVVTVAPDRDISLESLIAAVKEAGYEVEPATE